MSVSVIIAAYNVEETIELAISSLSAQTAPPVEVIVADDASTDRTCDVVRRLAENWPAIRLIEMPVNGGPSRARNAAIEIATGDWVAILDGDDYFKPTRLEVLERVGEEMKADFIADNLLFYDDAEGVEGRKAFYADWELKQLTAKVLFENSIPEETEFSYASLQPMLRRTYLDRTSIKYDGSMRYGEDIQFYGELLFNGAVAWIYNEPMYVYRTPVGEFSKVKTRYSKSVARFDLVERVNYDLLEKYKDKVDDECRRVMLRRGARLHEIHLANVAREFRRDGKYISYAACVLGHPGLLRLLLVRTARRTGDLALRIVRRPVRPIDQGGAAQA